jgi:single-strand DNA-binding protein
VNATIITVRGHVVSEPRHVQFDDGNAVASFRLASNERRFDRERREWVDVNTTFYTVNCRRGAAANAAASLRRGQPVIVQGRLRERVWTKDDRSGRSTEIEADGLGHDLTFGTSAFTRVVRAERLSGGLGRPGEVRDLGESGPGAGGGHPGEPSADVEPGYPDSAGSSWDDRSESADGSEGEFPGEAGRAEPMRPAWASDEAVPIGA